MRGREEGHGNARVREKGSGGWVREERDKMRKWLLDDS